MLSLVICMKNFIRLICFFCFSFSIANAQDKEEVSLTETKWVLSNLNNKVINNNEEGISSFMILSDDDSFTGFAGCNKFQGNYKSIKGKFTFSNIGATKMLCENNNNEDEFLKALSKVINYNIVDNQLMLMDKTKTIAVFEAEKAK